MLVSTVFRVLGGRVMTKPFKTIDEQIKILEDRGLSFKNKETAKRELTRYGYYEIINGYKDPFLETRDPDKYIKSATFEDIDSLFDFDMMLRSLTLMTMLNVESILKSIVSYTIAEEFGHLERDYLRRTNYKDGKKYEDGYKIDKLLIKFNKIIDDDTQPFKHYKQVHGNCPPWILVKGMTFGNLANFIKLQKSKVKKRIIARCYGIDEALVTEETKNFFMDSIFLFLAYRNRSAHGGRIYNYNSSKASVRFCATLHASVDIDESRYRQGFGKNDWTILKLALRLLENKGIAIMFSEGINRLLSDYYGDFPENIDFLIREMKILPEHLKYGDELE